MCTYKVGNETQQIKLAVDIETFGLAASRAIVVDMATTVPAIVVGQSTNASGDIAQTPIGMPVSLQNKRLSIRSKISLLGDSASNKTESGSLTGRYILDNGAEGHKEYSDPEKTISEDYSEVILTKIIDLIP